MRSRTTARQSALISSVGATRSGTMMVAIPAAHAARTPPGESSSARQCSGRAPRASAARRNVSGCGLPLATSDRGLAPMLFTQRGERAFPLPAAFFTPWGEG